MGSYIGDTTPQTISRIWERTVLMKAVSEARGSEITNNLDLVALLPGSKQTKQSSQARLSYHWLKEGVFHLSMSWHSMNTYVFRQSSGFGCIPVQIIQSSHRYAGCSVLYRLFMVWLSLQELTLVVYENRLGSVSFPTDELHTVKSLGWDENLTLNVFIIKLDTLVLLWFTGRVWKYKQMIGKLHFASIMKWQVQYVLHMETANNMFSITGTVMM